METNKTMVIFSLTKSFVIQRDEGLNSEFQLLLFGCPSSSAWQSEGFVNLRSWVQIPPRADIGSKTLVINESVPIPTLMYKR